MNVGTPSPTAQALLRSLLGAHVAPALRAHGFEGSGQDFHRRIADNWAAINIQRDRYSTARELRFTLNLGTASTAVRIEDGFEPDEPAREIDCHWRQRLGQLLPDGPDTWWTVRSGMGGDEIERLGSSIAAHVTERGVPAIEAMSTDEAILETVLPLLEPEPGMTPHQMDIAGPILRRLGPPARLARHLAMCDAEGERAALLYTMFDDFPARIGPARLQKRLADLSRAGFEPRQEAITDLGWARPSDEVHVALRPLLDDGNRYIRMAAAQALGRLGDVASAGGLRAMVRDDAARATAVHAAFALAKLDEKLDAAGRRQTRQAIRARRDRAVGHDRAALSELLRHLEPA